MRNFELIQFNYYNARPVGEALRSQKNKALLYREGAFTLIFIVSQLIQKSELALYLTENLHPLFHNNRTHIDEEWYIPYLQKSLKFSPRNHIPIFIPQ